MVAISCVCVCVRACVRACVRVCVCFVVVVLFLCCLFIKTALVLLCVT